MIEKAVRPLVISIGFEPPSPDRLDNTRDAALCGEMTLDFGQEALEGLLFELTGHEVEEDVVHAIP
jgi:hypothetical protein